MQLRVISANAHTYNGMAIPIMLEIFDGVDWHASANNTYTPAIGSDEAVSHTRIMIMVIIVESFKMRKCEAKRFDLIRQVAQREQPFD